MPAVLVTLAATMMMAGVLTLPGCGGNGEGDGGAQGIPVETARVTFEEVSVPIHTSGKLTSKTEARLSFKTGGIVGSMLADEGQSVAAGQLLAALEGDEIDARVAQARSGFDKAERDLNRAKRLYADSVITLAQLQDVETGLTMARSELEIAEFNQAHSSILAPTRGKILRRFVEANELVGPGSPVFLFGSSEGRWIVKAGLPDRDMIRLSLGDSARVSFDAYKDTFFPARVTEIGQAADPMSGTYEIELSVDDSGFDLVSGFVARVEIFPARCEVMYVIPIEALMEADGDHGYVYLPDEASGTAVKTPVTLGCLFGEEVAIRSGLEGADHVITHGAAYLTDNAAIRVIDRSKGRENPGSE